jgi:L-phenylalanine/L-methionine N-acetyltransferase
LRQTFITVIGRCQDEDAFAAITSVTAYYGSTMAFPDSVRSNSANRGLSIRRRDKRDTEALFQMFSQPQCRQGMAVEPFGSAGEVQEWFDANSLNNFDMVSTIEDKAIGFAGLFLLPGTQSHVGAISLFVHDEFHGRGIGTLMMTALVSVADILVGLRRLQLIVFCDNERAISLYHKFGFKIEGRHECSARRGDAFDDTFTMARIMTAESRKHADIGELCGDLRNLLSRLQSIQMPDTFPRENGGYGGSRDNEVHTGLSSAHLGEEQVQETS